MRATPAIALVIVGTALCGAALELFANENSMQQTVNVEDLLATIGTWLLTKFMVLARIMKNF